MKNYVITITRQFGSLGRDIGKRLADKLGIDYLDRDLIEKAAEDMGVSTHEVSQKDEKMNPFHKMLFPMGTGPALSHNQLFAAQRDIILDYANSRNCVIVGRCSDYVLRDYPNTLHIYFYAPYETRVKNSIDILGLSPEEAVRMVQNVDRARENYYKYYTGREMDSVKGKHLLIDTEILPEDDMVEMLEGIVKKHFVIS